MYRRSRPSKERLKVPGDFLVDSDPWIASDFTLGYPLSPSAHHLAVDLDRRDAGLRSAAFFRKPEYNRRVKRDLVSPRGQ